MFGDLGGFFCVEIEEGFGGAGAGAGDGDGDRDGDAGRSRKRKSNDDDGGLMRAAQLLKGPEPSQVLLDAEASVHTAEALALEQTRRIELQNFKRTNSEALANSVEAAHEKWQAAASAGGASSGMSSFWKSRYDTLLKQYTDSLDG